jgi:ATP-dependent RNA helicase DDX56/DBP9
MSKTFSDMNLDPRILRAIAKLGFNEPTLVQASGIPLSLSGKDVLARARTGSGKTAAYTIPIIQKILSNSTQSIQALILVPTRELAEQVNQHIIDLTKFCAKEVKSVNISVGDHLSSLM